MGPNFLRSKVSFGAMGQGILRPGLTRFESKQDKSEESLEKLRSLGYL